MPFDTKESIAVAQKSDGSYEPEEQFDLAKATPIMDGEVLEGNQKTVQIYPPNDPLRTLAKGVGLVTGVGMGKANELFDIATGGMENIKEKAPTITVDGLMSMPILGGFSPRQLEWTYGMATTIESEERSKSFKWVVLGMPDDLEGIQKADTLRWSQMAMKTPILKDIVNDLTEFAVTHAVGTVHPLLSAIPLPDSITKETVKQFPVELAADLIEFYTDPAGLLSAWVMGYGFKKLPSVLKTMEYKHPDLYRLLTTSLTQDKVALQQAYDVLGVPKNASATQINKAYRVKAIESMKARGEATGADPAITNSFAFIEKTRDTVYRQLIRMGGDARLKAWKILKNKRGSAGLPKELKVFEMVANKVKNVDAFKQYIQDVQAGVIVNKALSTWLKDITPAKQKLFAEFGDTIDTALEGIYSDIAIRKDAKTGQQSEPVNLREEVAKAQPTPKRAGG